MLCVDADHNFIKSQPISSAFESLLRRTRCRHRPPGTRRSRSRSRTPRGSDRTRPTAPDTSGTLATPGGPPTHSSTRPAGRARPSSRPGLDGTGPCPWPRPREPEGRRRSVPTVWPWSTPSRFCLPVLSRGRPRLRLTHLSYFWVCNLYYQLCRCDCVVYVYSVNDRVIAMEMVAVQQSIRLL